MRIFAGSAAVGKFLPAGRVGNKLAAVALFLSSQFEGAKILAESVPVSLGPAALDAQCSYLCAALVLVPSLVACCVHVRYIYHSESVLRNAAD